MEPLIFHIDVNSAYLSWTSTENVRTGAGPDLRLVPAIIGGDRKNRHGVVLAKSIPAKAFGIVTGEPVKLTPMEYNILLLLIRNQGKVFSINQIYESIWNEDAYGAENTVAVHIRHIREKIEINPKKPRYLKVVWGIGYKLEKI